MLSQPEYKYLSNTQRASLKRIDSLMDGRFSISETQFMDNKTGLVITRASFEPADDYFLVNVPGLNDDQERVNWLWLYALAHHPIPKISDAQLLDPETGIVLVAESDEHVLDGKFRYKFTKQVPHAFHSTYYHVPGFSTVLVSAEGEFRRTDNTSVIPSPINDYFITVTNDAGSLCTVHFAELALASRLDGLTDLDAEDIIFIDEDRANFKPDNLVVSIKGDASTYVSTREADDAIYLKVE